MDDWGKLGLVVFDGTELLRSMIEPVLCLVFSFLQLRLLRTGLDFGLLMKFSKELGLNKYVKVENMEIQIAAQDIASNDGISDAKNEISSGVLDAPSLPVVNLIKFDTPPIPAAVTAQTSSQSQSNNLITLIKTAILLALQTIYNKVLTIIVLIWKWTLTQASTIASLYAFSVTAYQPVSFAGSIICSILVYYMLVKPKKKWDNLWFILLVYSEIYLVLIVARQLPYIDDIPALPRNDLAWCGIGKLTKEAEAALGFKIGLESKSDDQNSTSGLPTRSDLIKMSRLPLLLILGCAAHRYLILLRDKMIQEDIEIQQANEERQSNNEDGSEFPLRSDVLMQGNLSADMNTGSKTELELPQIRSTSESAHLNAVNREEDKNEQSAPDSFLFSLWNFLQVFFASSGAELTLLLLLLSAMVHADAASLLYLIAFVIVFKRKHRKQSFAPVWKYLMLMLGFGLMFFYGTALGMPPFFEYPVSKSMHPEYREWFGLSEKQVRYLIADFVTLIFAAIQKPRIALQKETTGMNGEVSQDTRSYNRENDFILNAQCAWDYFRFAVYVVASKIVALIIFFVGAFKGQADLVAGGYLIFALYSLYYSKNQQKVVRQLQLYNFCVVSVQLLYQFPGIPGSSECREEISYAKSCLSLQDLLGLHKLRVGGRTAFADMETGLPGSLIIYIVLDWYNQLLESPGSKMLDMYYGRRDKEALRRRWLYLERIESKRLCMYVLNQQRKILVIDKLKVVFLYSFPLFFLIFLIFSLIIP